MGPEQCSKQAGGSAAQAAAGKPLPSWLDLITGADQILYSHADTGKDNMRCCKAPGEASHGPALLRPDQGAAAMQGKQEQGPVQQRHVQEQVSHAHVHNQPGPSNYGMEAARHQHSADQVQQPQQQQQHVQGEHLQEEDADARFSYDLMLLSGVTNVASKRQAGARAGSLPHASAGAVGCSLRPVQLNKQQHVVGSTHVPAPEHAPDVQGKREHQKQWQQQQGPHSSRDRMGSEWQSSGVAQRMGAESLKASSTTDAAAAGYGAASGYGKLSHQRPDAGQRRVAAQSKHTSVDLLFLSGWQS